MKRIVITVAAVAVLSAWGITCVEVTDFLRSTIDHVRNYSFVLAAIAIPTILSSRS